MVSLLGEGGMGQVYLVEHAHLHRREALKVITARGNPEFERRFTAEARMAATLDHPGIVTVYGYGIEQGTPWFTMAYADGQDLAHQRLSPQEAGLVVGQVADALDYAHRRQIIHRDIKPANIVVTRDPGGVVERAVVLDFGIAKPAGEATGLTATNAVIGTLAYLAPEIAAGHPAGPRSDQYSLACTAYQLVTGTTPFTETSAAALMMAHATRPPRPVSALRPDLAALDPVFDVALAKDPARRFPMCRAFADAFTAALNGGAPGGFTPPPHVTGDAPDTLPPPGVPALNVGPGNHPSGPQRHSPDRYSPAQYGPAQYSPTQSGPTRPEPPVAAGPRNPGRTTKILLGATAAVAVLVIAVATTIILVKGSGSNDSGDDLAVAPVNSGVDRSAPVVTSGRQAELGKATAIDGGITADGKVTICGVFNYKAYCWGDNSSGQLGTGTSGDQRTSPVKIQGLNNVTAISTEGGTTCAVADRRAYCWGADGDLQTGGPDLNRSGRPVLAPTETGLIDVTAISVGTNDKGEVTVCAISDGDAYCWGANGQRQVGDYSPSTADMDYQVPTKVDGIAGVTAISTGSNISCAVTYPAQTASCWGLDYSEQPSTLKGLGGISKVFKVIVPSGGATGTGVCVIADGDAYCDATGDGKLTKPVGADGAYALSSGRNKQGSILVCTQSSMQIYCGPLTFKSRLWLVRDVALTGVNDVAVAGGTRCTIAHDDVYCWGDNTEGQLGSGGTQDSLDPVRVGG
ncbi:protein kinase [Gordonia amarae]|uniref:non-specific serine/threonine protein kinase n=1 Tax=Gordonia amarae TaxID=36821 RepID=A0A857MAE1_9ACTN|nr:protein kinase [Gordonia amarae]MCS3877315.1 serine/threonine-protein kinase [Gordonia amarae]QHN16075.1 protein kinase [Gordonia amarae]QHN20643.1 protein kinase [Gordonia amarae]QHN29495.1 protein kinase [Gordonia amarae]QHN38271.1 protein kinase [Gordonia amarae]